MEKYRPKNLEPVTISSLLTKVLAAEKRATKCGCLNCHGEYSRAVANFRIEVSKQTGGKNGQQAINEYAQDRLKFLFRR